MTNKATDKSAWSIWWNNVPEGIYYPKGMELFKSFIGIPAKSTAYQDARFALLRGPHGPTLVKAWFARRSK